jgi:hypothetical protein
MMLSKIKPMLLVAFIVGWFAFKAVWIMVVGT